MSQAELSTSVGAEQSVFHGCDGSSTNFVNEKGLLMPPPRPGYSVAYGNSETYNVTVDREQYNSPEFVTKYKDAKFFFIKSYSEDNSYKSIFGGIMQMSIFKPSIVLIIQLNRFAMDDDGSRIKINRNISLNQRLALDNYLSKGADYKEKYHINIDYYSLFATIIHSGFSQDFGHYYAYVKNLQNDSWHRCNDANVSSVSKQEVLSDQQVYFFFFIRRESDCNGAGTVPTAVHDEMGLVNLLYEFQKYKNEENQYWYHDAEDIIISHGEVIEALSSVLVVSEGIFRKLFAVIIKVWVAEKGLKQPELSKSMARLVWPIPEKMNNAQHRYLLRTISSVFDSRPGNSREEEEHDDDEYNDDDDEYNYEDDFYDYIEGSLEVVTRAGLVKPVFELLYYAMLADGGRDEDPLGWVARGRTVSEEDEEHMIMTCFEILCFLSSVTIGRLEMVGLMKRSGFRYFNAFCAGIALVIRTDTVESHVIPALSVLCNLLENTRYTDQMMRAEGQGFDELKEFVDDLINYKKSGILSTGEPRTGETTQDAMSKDLLTSFICKLSDGNGSISYSGKFLQNAVMNFVISGRDTSGVALIAEIISESHENFLDTEKPLTQKELQGCVY